MLPGIALVYLFGNQGMLRGLLSDNIYGFWGIVLGEVIYTFPHALMILAVGACPWRMRDCSMPPQAWAPVRRKRFRSITWPATRQAVFAAFCLVFTLTITDFGVPGGGRWRLSRAGTGSLQGGGRPAAIRSRCVDRHGAVAAGADSVSGVDAWLRRRHGDSMSGRAQVFKPAPSKLRDGCYLAIVLLISAALLLVFGMAVFSSLVKFWPYNLSLSLNHYQFNDTAGGG